MTKLLKIFWPFKPRCKHEWLIGYESGLAYRPAEAMFPSVCRWCSERTILSAEEAHRWREWQRLEKERAAWPTGETK